MRLFRKLPLLSSSSASVFMGIACSLPFPSLAMVCVWCPLYCHGSWVLITHGVVCGACM
jgi:hypothetical protein